MANYQVTIGYKAIIDVCVSADSEAEAKEKALEYFKSKERHKWCNSKNTSLVDDSFAAHGCLNMDETWNMVNP